MGVKVPHDKYPFTEDMKLVTNIGGEVERTVRRMIQAGKVWLDNHDGPEPQIEIGVNVYGYFETHNEPADEMIQYMKDAVDEYLGTPHPVSSGPLLEIAIEHIEKIVMNGWDEYRVSMEYWGGVSNGYDQGRPTQGPRGPGSTR